MPSFTREQLRNFITNSADFSAITYIFTLNSNVSTTAGFAIEGVNKDIFNSASISNTVGCTFVSSSTNAAFLIDPNTTARFDFTPTSVLGKDLVKFSAPNVLSYNINDSTASGSVFGVDLNIGSTARIYGDICVEAINSKGDIDARTFKYVSGSLYNNEPFYTEFSNGALQQNIIRWNTEQWEVWDSRDISSSLGPKYEWSPLGNYSGSNSPNGYLSWMDFSAGEAIVTLGACLP